MDRGVSSRPAGSTTTVSASRGHIRKGRPVRMRTRCTSACAARSALPSRATTAMIRSAGSNPKYQQTRLPDPLLGDQVPGDGDPQTLLGVEQPERLLEFDADQRHRVGDQQALGGR